MRTSLEGSWPFRPSTKSYIFFFVARRDNFLYVGNVNPGKHMKCPKYKCCSNSDFLPHPCFSSMHLHARCLHRNGIPTRKVRRPLGKQAPYSMRGTSAVATDLMHRKTLSKRRACLQIEVRAGVQQRARHRDDASDEAQGGESCGHTS